MDWLAGYKTYIVFAVVLLNGVLNLFGWGLELPAEYNEWVEIVLAAVALILRAVTWKPGILARKK